MSEALAREGLEALRRGDGATARDRFEAYALVAGVAQTPWIMLAQAHRLTGNEAAEKKALERVLAAAPRDLPALLMMGALCQRNDDDRGATRWYQTALNQASILPDVQPALHARLGDAQAFLTGAMARYGDHLEKALKAEGVSGGPRLALALDLLLGRATLYQQQPTSFYFPGLPQRQFFERSEFSWLAAIEAEVPAMQHELATRLAEERGFSPYVVSNPENPAPSNPLRDDPSWGAHYLLKDGEALADNAAKAPRTMAALALAPQPVIHQRSPMALYSLLKPGTHIQPHNGLLNTRLICHVPLIAPAGCALRVGSETRTWTVGETLIFDDSIEHEAWNRGSETRIVLLFEIWRPEISPDERAALTLLYEAINDYSGLPQDQG
jgi:aspartyl/asparaginyl beta-hydroxylase (cupin superfamily)